MSKTISLETAKQLKAAADQAGVTLPTTDKIWANGQWFGVMIPGEREWDPGGDKWSLEDWNNLDLVDAITSGIAFEIIPAPDAEEIGEWLPGTWWTPHNLYNKTLHWNPPGWQGYYWDGMHGEGHKETQCEAWAALLIACLKADPKQIETHLKSLENH